MYDRFLFFFFSRVKSLAGKEGPSTECNVGSLCRTVASREHLMRRWDTLFVNHARAFGWLPAAVRPGASGACVCTADAFGAFNKLREGLFER